MECPHALSSQPAHPFALTSSIVGPSFWLPPHGAAVLQAVIRAVCAIIDAFHFPLPADAAAAAAPDSEQVHPVLASEMDAPAAPATAGADPAADAGPELAREIQGALVKRMLPALQAQLVRPHAGPAPLSILSPPVSWGCCRHLIAGVLQLDRNQIVHNGEDRTESALLQEKRL